MNVNGLVEEIVTYSEKTDDGRFVIPISVDFDFTITACSSWEEGNIIENDHCFDIMKSLENDFNCKFILNTLRTGENLEKAIDFIKSHGIELYGIGRNPIQDADGEISNKIFSIFDIDDKNIGVPLIYDKCDRPFVDWKSVERKIRPILKAICKELEKY